MESLISLSFDSDHPKWGDWHKFQFPCFPCQGQILGAGLVERWAAECWVLPSAAAGCRGFRKEGKKKRKKTQPTNKQKKSDLPKMTNQDLRIWISFIYVVWAESDQISTLSTFTQEAELKLNLVRAQMEMAVMPSIKRCRTNRYYSWQ